MAQSPISDLDSDNDTNMAWEVSTTLDIDTKPTDDIEVVAGGNLTIRLASYQWLMDKDASSNKSQFFSMALQEGRWKEGQEGHIELHDEDPIMFARCLQYVITGSYDHWIMSHAAGAMEPLMFLVNTQAEIQNMRELEKSFEQFDEVELTSDANARILSYSNRMRSRAQKWEEIEATRARNDLARAYIPKTKNQLHVIQDQKRAHGSMDIIMYQLGARYLMPDLQTYALSNIKAAMGPANRRTPYSTVYEIMIGSEIELDVMDQRLKRTLAKYIALDYHALRAGDDEAAETIKEWFRVDEDFGLIVMDCLAKVKIDDA